MKKKMRALCAFAVALCCLSFCFLGMVGCGKKGRGPVNDYERTAFNLSAVDDLGREVRPISSVNDKVVGLFYFNWHGQHGITPKANNIQEILKEYGADVLFDPAGSPESPTTQLYYWGEPLYGYYNSTDEWVVRRQMEMLAYAGVDYVAFDCTNADTYDAVWHVVGKVIEDMDKQGMTHPYMVFYTHNTASQASPKVEHLYNELYATGLYRSSWYMKDGKPVIITVKDQVEKNIPEIADFFYIRESQFHNEPFKENGVPWIDFERPQLSHNGTVSVSVAQNDITGRFSDTYVNDNPYLAKGRGYSDKGGYDSSEEAVLSGKNFQEQWDYAIEMDADEVFILGWNQWVAQKIPDGNGSCYFADEFSLEYSTDIEPMKGGYGDNFFMQMVQNIRRFKGSGEGDKITAEKTIDIGGSLSQWDDVTPYIDMQNDATERNSIASFDGIYTNKTNRNDITTVKIAHDSDNLYVYAACADDIVKEKVFAQDVSEEPLPKQDGNWMNLYIGTADTKKDFAGFGYLINRLPNENGTTSIEKINASFETSSAGEAKYTVRGNVIVYQIPRSALRLGSGSSMPQLTVKVTDCLQDQADVSDFYVSGDSAPIGRFGFTYGG